MAKKMAKTKKSIAKKKFKTAKVKDKTATQHGDPIVEFLL